MKATKSYVMFRTITSKLKMIVYGSEIDSLVPCMPFTHHRNTNYLGISSIHVLYDNNNKIITNCEQLVYNEI